MRQNITAAALAFLAAYGAGATWLLAQACK